MFDDESQEQHSVKYRAIRMIDDEENERGVMRECDGRDKEVGQAIQYDTVQIQYNKIQYDTVQIQYNKIQ